MSNDMVTRTVVYEGPEDYVRACGQHLWEANLRPQKNMGTASKPVVGHRWAVNAAQEAIDGAIAEFNRVTPDSVHVTAIAQGG